MRGVAAPGKPQQAPPAVRKVYRHPLPVRLTHWLNLLFLLFLLGSGLQIFNAHPALYWGERSDPGAELLLISARRAEDGSLEGVTRVLGRDFTTTGVLGISAGPTGYLESRAFPAWATIPGSRWLAMGRRWHFFFAWLFVLNWLMYVGYTLASSRHRADLFPNRAELRQVRSAARTHWRPRTLRRDALHGYNVLQKLAYLTIALGVVPLIILTGLAMSPWLNAAFPWLPELFAGRQSARTLHFAAACAFVLFTLVHVAMVFWVGPVNHLRAMITGRLWIPEPRP